MLIVRFLSAQRLVHSCLRQSSKCNCNTAPSSNKLNLLSFIHGIEVLSPFVCVCEFCCMFLVCILWIITSTSLLLYSANSKHSFQRSICWCFYLYFIISFENVGGVFFRSHAFTEFRAQDCHTHIHSKSLSVPFFLLHTLFRSVLSTIVKLNNNIHLPK